MEKKFEQKLAELEAKKSLVEEVAGLIESLENRKDSYHKNHDIEYERDEDGNYIQDENGKDKYHWVITELSDEELSDYQRNTIKALDTIIAALEKLV